METSVLTVTQYKIAMHHRPHQIELPSSYAEEQRACICAQLCVSTTAYVIFRDDNSSAVKHEKVTTFCSLLVYIYKCKVNEMQSQRRRYL